MLILSTSGTTGNPKGVPFSLERLLASGRALADSMDLGTADVGLNMGMPLHHVGGIACNLIAPLVSRGRCRFDAAFSAEGWLDAVAAKPQADARAPTVTWCYQVAAMWREVARRCVADPSVVPRHHLRLLRSGAARLPHTDAAQLAASFGCTVLPTYSMTECMPIASPPLGYALELPESVGSAIGGINIVILDTKGGDAPLAAGETGEVSLEGGSGAHLFGGYDGEPPRASRFRTGDLGHLDSDGRLRLTGRVREMINRGGEVLAPAALEDALCKHPDVVAQQLMVFAAAHAELQEAVGVAITPESAVSLKSLRAWARERLPRQAVPTVLVVTAALPRTATLLSNDGGGDATPRRRRKLPTCWQLLPLLILLFVLRKTGGLRLSPQVRPMVQYAVGYDTRGACAAVRDALPPEIRRWHSGCTRGSDAWSVHGRQCAMLRQCADDLSGVEAAYPATCVAALYVEAQQPPSKSYPTGARATCAEWSLTHDFASNRLDDERIAIRRTATRFPSECAALAQTRCVDAYAAWVARKLVPSAAQLAPAARAKREGCAAAWARPVRGGRLGNASCGYRVRWAVEAKHLSLEDALSHVARNAPGCGGVVDPACALAVATGVERAINLKLATLPGAARPEKKSRPGKNDRAASRNAKKKAAAVASGAAVARPRPPKLFGKLFGSKGKPDKRLCVKYGVPCAGGK